MFKTINGGNLPQRATKFSAGFDVFANEDVVIGAGETVLVGLGICLDIDNIGKHLQRSDQRITWFTLTIKDWMEKHYLELHPRSSLRAKGLGGGVGIIDMDYRDEIKMVIHNPVVAITKDLEFLGKCEDNIMDAELNWSYQIKKGDKIGQLILKRHEGWLLPMGYTKDEERMGGFGSTNKKEEEQK